MDNARAASVHAWGAQPKRSSRAAALNARESGEALVGVNRDEAALRWARLAVVVVGRCFQQLALRNQTHPLEG